MIWTTWRQHRAEAAVGGLILAALAVAALVVGSIARTRARGLGLPGCAGTAGGCGDALNRLHTDFHSIPPFISALVAVPLVAGMFWAAPLLSREYEAGTHRLAWTQSVSPVRWITTKIALVFGVAAAGALVLALLTTWALDPLSAAFGGRYNSTWYDVQGVVPVACLLFALAVGVLASAVIGRTIPAMALTLVVYAAARIPIHWIRWRFAPLDSRTISIPLSSLLDDPTGDPLARVGAVVPAGGWLHSVGLSDPTGQAISVNRGNFGVLQRLCPGLQVNPARTGPLDPEACRAQLQDLSLRARVTYQPASHFWLIQIVESLVFVALAVGLVAITIGWVARRRRT